MPITEARIRELLEAERPDYLAAAAEVGGDGLPILDGLVQEADTWVAAAAASLTAALSRDPAVAAATVPVLERASQHAAASVRAAAALGAGRVGAAGEALLVRLLDDADGGVRWLALRGASPPLSGAVAQAAEERAADDDDPSVRQGAVSLVARTPDPTLANELIAGILEFCVERLEALRAEVLVDVPAFAAGVGVAGFVDAGGQVRARLDAAIAALQAMPPSIAAMDLRGALTQLSTALGNLDQAARAVGGLSLPALLAARVDWGGPAFGGLAGQLGLPRAAPALALDTGTLEYRALAGGRQLAPAPLRLAFEAVELTGRLPIDGRPAALSVVATIRGMRLAVGGGPIAALLGGAGEAEADLAITLDVEQGLSLGGGAGGRVVLPARLAAGALDVRELSLEIPARPANTVVLAASARVDLGGAVQALVDGTGLQLHIDPARALRGDVPLSVAPKAPSGIGLSMDVGLVRGGGLLESRQGGYGGALQMRLGPVEVRAVGLLTVEPQFALVVVMSIEFLPPIDLSFGFTLNQVGGVIGVEHRLDADALRDGLFSGALDHLMFPPDPVAAAPTLLATLEHVFPVAPGAVVIGPMVELGWGRPVSFVTAQLGVIVSLPDPKVVVIGRGRIALPAPQLPIIDLRAAVVGEITEDHLLVLATLNGSRVATYPLSGDVGLLMRWGGSPEFAISAGGFHPRYTPPPELGGLHRLAMDLSPPAILTMRSESYFALTTNSVQFGARIELAGDIGVADIHGHFAFDALILLSPRFAFEIDVTAGLTVRALGTSLLGVRLGLHVAGPAPWRAQGSAEVEILWTPIPVDVGPFTWGDPAAPPPEPVDARALVHAAIHRNPGAWRSLVPPEADRVARLAGQAADEASLLVHPMAVFDIRQHAVPLETTIARVGPNPAPEGQRRVNFGVPLINGVATGALSEVTDLFAPGNYFDLNEEERLSRPAFEPMPAGVRVLPPGEAAPFAAARQVDLRYETFVCGEEALAGRRSGALADVLMAATAGTALAAGAAGRSALRARHRYAGEPDPIALADPGEVIAIDRGTVEPAAGRPWQRYTPATQAPLDASLLWARLGVA